MYSPLKLAHNGLFGVITVTVILVRFASVGIVGAVYLLKVLFLLFRIRIHCSCLLHSSIRSSLYLS